MLKNYLKLMRPHQYVKNLFIFIPILLGMEMMTETAVLKSVIIFVAFSLLSSTIYILNDMMDVESDRKHPTKKNRPLAAGTVSRKAAILLLLVLSVNGLVMGYSLDMASFLMMLGYVVLNFFYCVKLKHVPVLDICIIATGFIIRLIIGSTITDIKVSKWIVLMIFFLALFLALSKRRDDALIYSKTGVATRRVIVHYNLRLINAAIIGLAVMTVGAYVMYLLQSQTSLIHIPFQIAWIVLGTGRYLFRLFYRQDFKGSPTKILLKDKIIQVAVTGWAISSIFFQYNPMFANG